MRYVRYVYDIFPLCLYRCKPGYFGINVDDPLGCMSCFCHGHSSICDSAISYSQLIIHSEFDAGNNTIYVYI